MNVANTKDNRAVSRNLRRYCGLTGRHCHLENTPSSSILFLLTLDTQHRPLWLLFLVCLDAQALLKVFKRSTCNSKSGHAPPPPPPRLVTGIISAFVLINAHF